MRRSRCRKCKNCCAAMRRSRACCCATSSGIATSSPTVLLPFSKDPSALLPNIIARNLQCKYAHLYPSCRTAYMADPEAVAVRVGIRSIDGQDLSVIHSVAEGGGVSLLIGGKPRADSLMPVQCTICYDTTSTYSALACGHPFCNSCYANFISHKIADDGHECFFARCPEPKCTLVISPQLVTSLVRDEDKLIRYEKAADLSRAYVDDQPSIKWCPADCGRAVRCNRSAGTANLDLGVRCACSHRFCFSCMEEDHSPASCHDLKQWQIKCRDDSETYNWLVANTKPCPKCQTSIEKNGGCNHSAFHCQRKLRHEPCDSIYLLIPPSLFVVTCKKASCKHEFCWVCCGPWKDHSGSYYSCNK